MVKTDILVIGAGVVGLSAALHLLNLGREVLLIDPAQPEGGTANGSAGTIADYAVLPVGSPEILKNLPALLFDKNSPFAIRRAAILSLAPWLMRFLYESTPKQTAKNAQAIANLAADARARWEVLAKQINGGAVLQKKGCLYVYTTPAEFQKGGEDIARRKAFGVAVEMLTPHELAELEPNLAGVKGGAAFFYNAMFMDAPEKMLELLRRAVIAAGGLVQKTRAIKIERNGGGLARLENAAAVRANHIIIAAGAHSKLLAQQAGDRIPLETERGYHVEYDMEKPPLLRPACFPGRGFYLCPMRGRLRAAGTVELGGLSPAISAHRIKYLKRAAAGVFPHLPKPDRHWLGFRPSIPDSRPVISASKKGDDIIYAFGHGHIGITLAPITAEIIASIIMKTPPPVGLGDYSVNRF